MAGDQRLIADFGYVPKTFFRNMSKVYEYAFAITFAHKTLSRIREAWARIWRLWIGKRHTMAKNIVTAPNRTERTQASRVKHFERCEIGINGFASLHMQHGGEDIVGNCLIKIAPGAAKLPGACLFEL